MPQTGSFTKFAATLGASWPVSALFFMSPLRYWLGSYLNHVTPWGYIKLESGPAFFGRDLSPDERGLSLLNRRSKTDEDGCSTTFKTSSFVRGYLVTDVDENQGVE